MGPPGVVVEYMPVAVDRGFHLDSNCAPARNGPAAGDDHYRRIVRHRHRDPRQYQGHKGGCDPLRFITDKYIIAFHPFRNLWLGERKGSLCQSDL
jgi:hypothetical protein